MEQIRLHASDLLYLLPEITLVVAAIVMSLIDLFLSNKVNRHIFGWMTILSLAISAAFVIARLGINEPIVLLSQSYRIDDFANLFKLFFLGGTALIVLMSIGTVKKEEVPHLGEMYYMYLPATLGAMVMASSGDLITLFIGLELLSITSYIMVAMRKHNKQSNEGALKYVILGAISSAFVLYGMSFLYGMTGSTNIAEINAALMQYYDSFASLIYVSFFLILAGIGIKIAAAPFHAWAPDVYQGAITPVTSYLAVISKAASFAILFRVVYSIYYGMAGTTDTPFADDIYLSIAVLAAIAMIVGNFLALKQKNVKRLLAYSGVANAGYLLVPIATSFSMFHFSNFAEFSYYLVAYLLMNIGAFAVLIAVSEASGNDELSGFAGLYYRAPYTAVAMVILVLSLAGLPVTAGFFGKLYIIMGTLQLQNYWLALIMIGTSILSYYYYFGFIRQMFMRSSGESTPVRIPTTVAITVWFCVAATVILGLFPQIVIEYVQNTFSLIGDFFIR